MTLFQKKCYEMLEKVPQGYITTYADLAIAIGHKGAYRAVGSAMNKNPYAPKVPCHRVVKSNGDLGGYAFGSAIKTKRLHQEGVLVSHHKIVNFKNKLFKF
jgi:methylated-DNA-[protein]-cysteine S-methyltransferase